MPTKSINFPSEKGFSLIEILIVLTVLVIITTVAIIGYSSKRLYAADDQALKIMDVFQEARQRALTQASTFRVELNDTKKQIRLIDENNTASAADDQVLSTLDFDPNTTVGTKPPNVKPVAGIVPQRNYPVPEITYTQTTYPSSATDRVKTLRFIKSGEVVDGGTDDLGTGAIVSGVTIYVYNGSAGNMSTAVRAVTLGGVTAVAHLFKCQTNGEGYCTKWIN